MPTPKPSRDETLVKALVRGHRWRRKIECGQAGQAKSITDLAEQEGVTDAYVCQLLPLTCLAPDIVEAILDGRQPKGLRLAEVAGKWAAGVGGAARRLGLLSELRIARLAQQVAALHLAPAGLPDDRMTLASWDVLQPAIDELAARSKPLLLNQPGGRLLWGFSKAEPIVRERPAAKAVECFHDAQHRRGAGQLALMAFRSRS